VLLLFKDVGTDPACPALLSRTNVKSNRSSELSITHIFFGRERKTQLDICET